MDYKIIIDAGHGGLDSGAVSGNNLEKNINLNIAKLIYEKLKDLGLDVYITRDTDTTLDPTNRINRIKQLAGNSDKVLVISNHINSGGGSGSEVIYALRDSDTLANLILDNLKDIPLNIRESYQRRLPSNPREDYYYILRNTSPFESIIVEYGFIDNQSDINILNNRQNDLANATVKGILEYIGYQDVINETETYEVKPGDTLYSISKRFNIPVEELKRINNLNSNILSIGQILNLNSNDNNDIYIEYIVKKGDNLYSIAKRYNISQRELMELNNLKTNLLQIGQILRIPGNNLENTIYMVLPGDTLYAIAKKNNTTVDEIKAKNNLTSNTLSIGQMLII